LAWLIGSQTVSGQSIPKKLAVWWAGAWLVRRRGDAEAAIAARAVAK